MTRWICKKNTRTAPAVIGVIDLEKLKKFLVFRSLNRTFAPELIENIIAVLKQYK